MSSILPTMAPEVHVEREGSVVSADAAGVQISVDAGDEYALATLAVPLELLRALRALLNHPQMVAILGEADARPPVA